MFLPNVYVTHSLRKLNVLDSEDSWVPSMDPIKMIKMDRLQQQAVEANGAKLNEYLDCFCIEKDEEAHL